MFKTEAEALQAAKDAADGTYIDFDGQNCNDYLEDDQAPCSGWDGKDTRCDCGNRRVGWATDGDEETGFYAWATAN